MPPDEFNLYSELFDIPGGFKGLRFYVEDDGTILTKKNEEEFFRLSGAAIDSKIVQLENENKRIFNTFSDY